MSIKNKSQQEVLLSLKKNSFTVNLFDKRGITNRDPIPYKVKLITGSISSAVHKRT